jgi:hypothetical protein
MDMKLLPAVWLQVKFVPQMMDGQFCELLPPALQEFGGTNEQSCHDTHLCTRRGDAIS